MNNIADIVKKKIRQGTATNSEIAAAIKQDKYLLFNALMDNNLQDVNVTLREDLGNKKYLPLIADRTAMTRIINSYIQTDNEKALQKIIDEFDFNPEANNYTTTVLPMLRPDGGFNQLQRGFAEGASEIGTGIGGFLGPIFNSLGSDTSTTEETKSGVGTTTILVIVGVFVFVIVGTYLLFFYKPSKPATT